jgi:hypothetical protein
LHYSKTQAIEEIAELPNAAENEDVTDSGQTEVGSNHAGPPDRPERSMTTLVLQLRNRK